MNPFFYKKRDERPKNYIEEWDSLSKMYRDEFTTKHPCHESANKIRYINICREYMWDSRLGTDY